MWYVCGRQDMFHPWLLERCREVESEPDERLDLWAREHYKSTIITFGKTIQDILASHGDEPLFEKELTFGIFSHTRSISKKFLRQIRQELERNVILRDFFDDVLYWNPEKESSLWTNEGLIVRRRSNQKEATIEAWGVVDSQPTSAHFDVLVYDDIVTRDSVSTPEMIEKTLNSLELSYNLGSHGGKRRFIGTRYSYNDAYRTIMERGTATKRLYPATEDGSIDGKSVFISNEVLAKKLRDMGTYTFSAQMLQNPMADRSMGFKREWLRWFEIDHGDRYSNMNRYIIVDPANEKKKDSDRTAMLVIGLGQDSNYRLLDAVYDRLNLTERADELIRLHRKWKPISVGYEKYGKDADIEHIKFVCNKQNYMFSIIPLGGTTMSKRDRIRRLIPIFEAERFYLPSTLYKTLRTEKKTIDVIELFLTEEYDTFPVGGAHDDMLDCMARIVDENLFAVFPESTDDYTPVRKSATSWVGKY